MGEASPSRRYRTLDTEHDSRRALEEAAPVQPEHALGPVLRIVLLLVAAGFALSAARDVALPVAAAALSAMTCWPIYRGLAPRIGRALASVCAMLVALLFVGAIMTGIAYSGKILAEHFIERREQISSAGKDLGAMLGVDVNHVAESLRSRASNVAQSAVSGMTGLVLALAFMSLFLFDADFVKGWVGRRSHRVRHVLGGCRQLSHDLARYVYVRSGVGVLTGVLTSAVCWALSIRLALVWGFINFLLNYIPTIGSVIGVVPPVVFFIKKIGDQGEAKN